MNRPKSSSSTRLVLAFWAALVPSALIAQSHSPGILFPRGNLEGFSQYLELTTSKPLQLPSKFAISFDLSIWDPPEYGEVFQFKDASGAGGREGASGVAYACAFLSAVAQVGVGEEIHGGVRNACGAAEGCYCRKERFDIEEIAKNSSKEVHLIFV